MTQTGTISREVEDLRDRTIALRNELHEYPELAFEEHRTAALVAGRMRDLGLHVEEGIGGTGVLALLEGTKPGKTLLLRLEMDGVDMEEAEGRPYRSKLANHNHCCGHDVAMAVAVSTAELLARHRDEIAGRVAFVFQPADEPMRGALSMIEDGLLDRARPDYVLGLHVLPHIAAGQVVVQGGPLWASRDSLIVKLGGPPPARGGVSSAFPLAVAGLVTRLHERAEELRGERELVNFGVAAMRAESGFGLATAGELTVNFGCYDAGLRDDLLQAVEALIKDWCAENAASYAIEADYAIPPLLNDAYVAGVVRGVAAAATGEANIVTGWRNPLADDVAFFTSMAPACYMLFGSTNAAKGITGMWHTPEFDIDEDVLPLAVRIISGAALELLSSGG